MEKFNPSFSLTEFKNSDYGTTITAKKNARALGFDDDGVKKVISTMELKHFYKSMTSYADHRIWQDVYHVPYDDMILYVKFTQNVLSEFTLLSFKEKLGISMIAETIVHPITGETLYRDVRPIEYTYKGESITVDQPGWYPKDGRDDDGILSQEDSRATDYALHILKARHQQKLQANELELDTDNRNVGLGA